MLRGRKREVPAPSIHTELSLFTWESKELSRSLSPGSSPRFIPRTGTPSAGTARLPHPKNTANSPLLPQHHPTFGAAPRNTRVISPQGRNSVCQPCPLSPGHAVSHALRLGHPHVPRSCANSFHGRLEHRHTNTVAIPAAVLPRCVSFTHITSTGSLPAHHLCINSRLARSWPDFWAPLLQRVNGGFAAAKRNGLFAQEAFT